MHVIGMHAFTHCFHYYRIKKSSVCVCLMEGEAFENNLCVHYIEVD